MDAIGAKEEIMSKATTIVLEKKYAFPLFTKPETSVPLASNQKLVISDIWALWDYIIKKFHFEQPFMNSLIEQAKYFYKAAEDSPTKSKPLLYYYSFLNFSKVLINIDKRYGKSSFIYQHGVTEKNNGTFLLSEIEIQPLKNDVKNVCAELAQTLDGTITNAKKTIKIKDLLNHCVGIHRTYCELYNQQELFCKIGEIELKKTGRKLVIDSDVQCTDNRMAALKSVGYNIIKEGNQYIWHEEYNMPDCNITRNQYYEFSKLIRQKGIWYFLGVDGYTKYLSLGTSNRFPPEIIIYNTMFYLGSITRYHPYLFDDIFSEKEQWLMSEFLTTQPKQYLYLATAKVLGQNVLKSYCSF
jgi:hypothetical protein